MPFDLEPVSVIERTARDSSRPGKPFSRMCDRAAARGAKLQTKPSVGFVGAVLIGSQRFSRDLDVLLVEPDRQEKRASGSALAKRAMTDNGTKRLSNHLVPNRPANTTTFVDLSHLHPSQVPSSGANVRAHARAREIVDRGAVLLARRGGARG